MVEMTRFKADMFKWTTPEGQKLFLSLEILEMIGVFFRIPQAQRLSLLAHLASSIMGSCRCSFILQKNGKKHDNKKLFLVAGYPNKKSAHGIGLEITPAMGKIFLNKVIKEGNIVIIPDSPNDPRVAYMKEMILCYGIMSQLFVTVYSKRLATGFEKDPYGLVIFDSTAENPIVFQNNIIPAKKIAMVAAAITMNDERRNKIDYNRFLDEHADGLKDEFRNTPASLAAFAKKIQLELEQIAKKLPGDKNVKRALANAKTIIEVSSGFERKSNEFLLAIQLRMSGLDIQEYDLQEFIESVTAEFTKKKEVEQKKVCVPLNFRKLVKNKKVRFDREKIKECLWAIMDNAVKHEAKNIYFDITVKYKKTSVPNVVMTIYNDGSLIDPSVGRQLLQHFSSADRQTGSGGLATAKSIIQTHGGKIDLEIEPETQFTIELPIV